VFEIYLSPARAALKAHHATALESSCNSSIWYSILCIRKLSDERSTGRCNLTHIVLSECATHEDVAIYTGTKRRVTGLIHNNW